MFTFLLVVHALIAAALVAVILMQRSEGGGLGMGSGPSGLMTARGAADFLTRATGILATLFVLMAFLLAAMAATRNSGSIDTSLAGHAPAGPITAPQPTSPVSGIPMMGAPSPAAPDPLTAQALAPAAGGPPTRPAPEAQAERRAAEPTTGSIERNTGRPIARTEPAPTVGINGVSNGGAPRTAKDTGRRDTGARARQARRGAAGRLGRPAAARGRQRAVARLRVTAAEPSANHRTSGLSGVAPLRGWRLVA
ncbi:preprotein translocase subunit SecG [Sphingomonas sp.]|uniref:preprotein translocase subunit SecG n=1 Tax=Sphingomonas sp. TaxID=28214 RepID=UPI003B002799